jgi:general secretion pathway protein J
MLGVSSATMVHTDAWAECARAKNAAACVTARLKPATQKKEEQL